MIIITEQSGAKWIAQQTGQTGTRALWVSKLDLSTPSAAKPGVTGFYADSINSACDMLNN